MENRFGAFLMGIVVSVILILIQIALINKYIDDNIIIIFTLCAMAFIDSGIVGYLTFEWLRKTLI